MSVPSAALAAESPDEVLEPRVANIWPIMGGMLLVLLLSALDSTIVGTAMPRVIAQLNGFDRYTWVTTAYLLTSTVTVPIYGKLSDLLGRKRVFMLGTLIFLLGSALCGLAQTMTQLIIFRGLQGLGAGALVPVSMAVIGDLFPPGERGKWQGIFGASWGIAGVVGPALGGWITDNLSWRWVFYVNLPIGALALAVLLLAMPALRNGTPGVRIDVLGALLLVAGLVPLLLALTWAGSSYAWTSPLVIALLAGGLAILSVFTIYETRHPEPIVEPRLFRRRIFTVSVVTTAFISAGLLASTVFVPLFLQGVSGTSATRSGAVLTPLNFAAGAGAIGCGQILRRWSRYYVLGLINAVFMIAGMLALLRLGVHSRAVDAAPGLICLGIGYGIGVVLFTVVIQNAFPRAQLGQVSGALIFFRSIGGTIGLAVMGSLLTARYSEALHATLPSAVIARTPAAAQGVFHNPQLLLQVQTRQVMEQAFQRLGPEGPRLLATVRDAIRPALAEALHAVYLAGLLIAVLAFVVVVFLPEIQLPRRAPRGR